MMVFVNTLARLVPAARLDLISLLCRPRDGIPPRRVRDRAGLGIAAGDVAPGRGPGSSRPRRHPELRAPPGALRVGAGHRRSRRCSGRRSCACSSSAAGSVRWRRRRPQKRSRGTRPASPASPARASSRRASTLGERPPRRCGGESSRSARTSWPRSRLMGPLGHAGLAGAASVGAYVNLVVAPGGRPPAVRPTRWARAPERRGARPCWRRCRSRR